MQLWRSNGSKQPAPTVDFKRFMVLAVFGGKQSNCSGYELESSASKPDAIDVRVVPQFYQTLDSSPSGGADQSTPYGFFVLPKTVKPIVVLEPHYVRIGVIDRWDKRAKLPALNHKPS